MFLFSVSASNATVAFPSSSFIFLPPQLSYEETLKQAAQTPSFLLPLCSLFLPAYFSSLHSGVFKPSSFPSFQAAELHLHISFLLYWGSNSSILNKQNLYGWVAITKWRQHLPFTYKCTFGKYHPYRAGLSRVTTFSSSWTLSSLLAGAALSLFTAFSSEIFFFLTFSLPCLFLA